ncbi:MAG: thiolase family protein [Variovorax sp.]
MTNRRVAIVGTSAIPVGRHQSADGDALHNLEHEILVKLVVEAAADAGITKQDVDGLVFTTPRPYTRQKYLHTFITAQLGLACQGSVLEVMGNGMTAALALDQACNEILLGRANVTLALGINMESAVSAADHAMSSMRTTGDVDFQVPAGFTPISWYAMDAMRYMHEHGATREHFAAVAVKNRFHASLNPLAQFRNPTTMEEVLAQRPIVEPLGLYDVPARSDGAVCLVLASEEVAKSLNRPYVLIRGRGFQHDGRHQIGDRPADILSFEAARSAGAQAYAQAGLEPADVDLAEPYAPCTIVEILVGEALGLTPRGRGAIAALEGETRLGGRIPISTSGGLTSRGHPSYVTSLYNYVELAAQLRGTAGERQVADARIGIGTGELGNYNAALVHIFEGVR